MESRPSPSSSSDVDEDDHEASQANKRPRYSPVPDEAPEQAVAASCQDEQALAAAVVSCHDEPSSSHCNDPPPHHELSRLQARLVEREQELEQQRTEAETFLRELQESVMCPVCIVTMCPLTRLLPCHIVRCV